MNPATLYGMRVFESPLAVTTVQNRPHKKRRGQSAAYHRRISKKWAKRYGATKKPGAYLVDAGIPGLGSGRVWVMHPELLARLRVETGRTMFGFDESTPFRSLAPRL